MQNYVLKLTSAMVIDGHIARAGSKVTLDERTAKDFLRRGRAELVDVAGGPDPVQQEEPSDLDLGRLNKSQLLEVAAQVGIEADESMTKAEIIAAIEGGNEE